MNALEACYDCSCVFTMFCLEFCMSLNYFLYAEGEGVDLLLRQDGISASGILQTKVTVKHLNLIT